MSPKKMIGLSFAAPAAKLYEVFDKLKPPKPLAFGAYYANQKSAFPTVRGSSSTSRMFWMPVRYMIMRSKPRP